MRSRSGQPCSLCRAVDLRVLRPARRIHIRRRGRVLHNSPPPASVRSAGGPDRDRAWHLWSSSSLDGVPRPRSRSPRRLSRRLHGVTRRHASSAGYRLLALRRVPPRIRRTEPSRVAQLATRHAVPLPHYMLNPFKRSQQPLIGSPQAGNSAANQTRKQAFYNGSVGSPDNRDKTDLAKQKKHPQQSCMVGISQAMKPHSSD